jgi:dTDP-4-dehydrorhamnose reductase
MLPRVFVTGGSGLFGLNLVLQQFGSFHFGLLQNSRKINLPLIDIIRMDLSSCADIEAGLKSFMPDIVINAAGMTNVDVCDENPSEANFINGVLAGNLAKVSYELGIKFVHISTDHLFDGTKSFVSENAAPDPVNAYGFSKALGEELVQKNNPHSLIVRCNFFGWGPSYKSSFSDFIVHNLSKNKYIKLADDIYYTPASTVSLINSIYKLIDMDAGGIFNIVGSQRISKYEFGLEMANIFSLPAELIKRVQWESLDAKAKRPMDMSLSDRKIRDFIGQDLGTVRQNIIHLKTQIGTSLFERIAKI